MKKELAVIGCTAFGALSFLAPFSAQKINAGADVNAELGAYLNFYGMRCTYVLPSGNECGVNGELGSLVYAAGANPNPYVMHYSFDVSTAQYNGNRLIEDKTRDYTLQTTGWNCSSIAFERNGIVLTDILSSSAKYECDSVPGYGYTVDVIGAWYPVGVVVDNPYTFSYSTTYNYGDFFSFQYPAELFNYDVVNIDYKLTITYIGDYYFPYISFDTASEPFNSAWDTVDYYQTALQFAIESAVQPAEPPSFDFMGAILDNVDSMLNFEIFPNFTFFDIMYIAFGISFFFFILKVFLGG